jgi:hypothetical protein
LFSLGDVNIIGILIEFVLPIVLTAALLMLRKRCRFSIYILAAVSLVAIAFGLWLSFPDITTFHRAPMYASGLAGFAFIPAFISMVLVCAVPPVSVWRVFQPFVSVVCAVFSFMYYSWLA